MVLIYSGTLSLLWAKMGKISSPREITERSQDTLTYLSLLPFFFDGITIAISIALGREGVSQVSN